MGRKHDAKYRFFRDIDSSIKAYWLGVLWGDGNNYRSSRAYQITLEVSDKDYDWVKKFKKDMNATHEIKKIPGKKAIRLRVFSKKMSNDLIKQGVVPNKGKNKTIPKIARMFLPHFIRGLFDADGCISNVNNRKIYVNITNTKSMCDFILDYIRKETNTNGGVYHQRNETYFYQLSGRNQVENFKNLIYKDAQRKLDRKYNTFI